MRLYVEVALRSFRRHLAYRGATLAGLFTNTIFGIMLASVFIALYQGQNQEQVAGFSVTDAVTFIWVGQSLIMVIALWRWWEIAAAIKSGDIISDLMKPFSFYGYWLSRDLGRAASQLVTRLLPTLLIGAVLFELALPASVTTWSAFTVSVSLAVVVSFGWRFMLNLTAFWLLDVRGVISVSMLLVNFFSGFLVPLAFFPPWLRTIAELLPFRAFVMIPIEVFLGQRGPVSAISIQLFWALTMVLVGHGVLWLGLRKVVVQCG